jgi:tetratricopeptide (TPR) repeat protein
MGRLTEAVPLCHKAIPVLERLCQDEPDNGEFIVSLCAAYGNLGNTLRDLGKPQQGLTWYDQALPRLEALLKREPSHELARLIYRSMRVERALALARFGSHAQARQEVEAALRDPKPPGELLYEASRVFAAAAAAVDKGGKPAPSDRDKLRRGYADRCLELLRAANDAGYFQEPTRIGQFKNEPDFAGVREYREFGELLNRLEKPRR